MYVIMYYQIQDHTMVTIVSPLCNALYVAARLGHTELYDFPTPHRIVQEFGCFSQYSAFGSFCRLRYYRIL